MFILMISLSTTLISAILFFDNVRFDDEGDNRKSPSYAIDLTSFFPFSCLESILRTSDQYEVRSIDCLFQFIPFFLVQLFKNYV